MKSLVYRYRSSFVVWLAFLCLAVLNAIVYCAEIAVSPLDAGAHPSLQLTGPRSVEPSPIAIGQLTETLAKPLFSPTRRSYAPSEPPPTVFKPPEPAVVVAPLAPPTVRFQGTRIIRGKPAALISDGNGMLEWVQQGEDVSGWEIMSIEAGQLTLRAKAQTLLLNLYEQEQ